MDDITGLVSEIRAFRPFLPAKEFETSLRFYKAIGFRKVSARGDSRRTESLGLTPSCSRAITSRNGQITR